MELRAVSSCMKQQLTKTIQLLIDTNQYKEFCQLSFDPQLIHTLFTSRYSLSLSFPNKLIVKFGHQLDDLNALELALLQNPDGQIGCHIFQILTPHPQLKSFLEHRFHRGIYSVLDIATFWGHSELIRDIKAILCTNPPSFLLKKANEVAMFLNNSHRDDDDDGYYSSLTTHQLINNNTSPSYRSLSSFSSTSSGLSLPHLRTWTPSQQKKVHFEPSVVILDACSRGDKEELMMTSTSKLIDLDTIRDGQNNRSLLHIALLNGHEDLVKYLIVDRKMDINSRDNDGWTCLHYAAALELWNSVKFLVSKTECDVNALTRHGLRVEECATSEKTKRKSKLVIQKVLQRR
ncbi:uncharacterized protein BX663DRAFT_483059 [Cokeromyces recurvatus]|uniref:uncharacterized protein n=1 Tax=Cokeromyces recurvatus TaxID=90255 RepID=UPI0022205951|nr:uncharacterized protein BX663DRAFT_483059 [Cokeromyces recurvatus]KAI7906303.1 hypothetical protein BX663DRAFT_483059 [Cokeromyces recurvatus]